MCVDEKRFVFSFHNTIFVLNIIHFFFFRFVEEFQQKVNLNGRISLDTYSNK